MKFLSFFNTEITPGKVTVVPRAGTRVVLLYLMQVQGWYRCTSCRYKGGTVVPRAGTRVVPSYLLEVHYPFCSTQYICFANLSNDLGRQAAVQLQVQR